MTPFDTTSTAPNEQHFPEQMPVQPIAPMDADMNLAEDREVVGPFQTLAAQYFEAFDEQQSYYRDLWRVYDGMGKCMQNRALMKEEKAEGANSPNDTRSQVGSTTFQRGTSQAAALVASILLGKKVPGGYSTRGTDNVEESYEDGKPQAASLNTLLEFTARADKWAKKFYEIPNYLMRMGNIPVMVALNRRKTMVRRMEPIYEPVETGDVDPITGEPVMVAQKVGEEPVWEEKIVENFPTLRMLPVDCVFADVMRDDLNTHDCVLIASQRTKSEILSDVQDGYFVPTLMEKLNATNAVSTNPPNQDAIDDRLQNRNLPTPQKEMPNQYTQWDVYMRCPIDNQGKWAEDTEKPELFLGTFIGDDLSTAVCARLTQNPDPDGEIPIIMLHARPEDSDMLYHVAPGDLVRSNYSVECTIKNLSIDSKTKRLEAPWVATEGEVNETQDFSFNQQRVLWEKSKGALRWLGSEVPDTTVGDMEFLNFIQQDSMIAIGMNQNEMGMSYGARTSSYEASNIQAQSSRPNLMQARYIIEQLVPWLLFKHWRYWEAYGIDGQIVSITDQPKQYSVDPNMLHGPFDIKVDVLDEYEDTVLQGDKMFRFLQTLSTIPQMANSVDWTDAARKVGMKLGLHDVSFIKNMPDEDSDTVAEAENVMMQQGIMARPKQGENHAAHLKRHKAKRLEWKGLDNTPQGQWVAMYLEPHIEETEAMAGGEASGAGAMAGGMGGPGMGQLTPGAPPPGISGNQSEGESRGNMLAAAQGGGAGGMPVEGMTP